VHAETVATYDRIAPRFAEQWWGTRLTEHMERFAAALPTADGVVLDLGCGPGRDTEWVGALGCSSAAIGLDASMGMLREARRRVTAIDVVQGDLVALPFADGSADGAWVCASLLHLTTTEAAAALRDVARVLRPAGALFCGVQVGEGSGVKSSPAGDRRFTFWSPPDFATLVAAAGFDVTATDVRPSEAAPVTWVSVHAQRAAS
jgi:SAM-dependent methyltransferase